MSEFKTVGQAVKYCRTHGLEIRCMDENLFKIAEALYKVDQQLKAANEAILEIHNISDGFPWSALTEESKSVILEIIED